MYSAMIFLVESERLRLMRSESKAIAKRKHEQRRECFGLVSSLKIKSKQSREERRWGW